MVANIPHWIDGQLTDVAADRLLPVFNPAAGEQTGVVSVGTSDIVDRVVASAAKAAEEWRTASLSRRTAVLFAFRELLNANVDRIASVVTSEHGKVLSDARAEVARGLENVEFATGVSHLMKGGFSEQVATGVDVYPLRQPLGVCAGITPFNGR